MPLPLSYVYLADRSCCQRWGAKHGARWNPPTKEEGLCAGLIFISWTRPTRRFWPLPPPRSILPPNKHTHLPKHPQPLPTSYLNADHRSLIITYHPPSTIPLRTRKDCCSYLNFWAATGGRAIWEGGTAAAATATATAATNVDTLTSHQNEDSKSSYFSRG